MTRQLKLVRLDDFIADIDSLDLLSGGFTLAHNGYQPKACAEGDTSAIETLTLQIQGASQDDIASKLHSLDDKIKQACWWADDMGVERYQVWLRVQLDNESNPRQAQIIHITPPDKVKIFTPEEYNGNWLGQYILGIERTPWWESTSYIRSLVSSVSAVGGIHTFSDTERGDVPARIGIFALDVNVIGESFNKFWAGFRTSRFGTVANFVPIWNLHKASATYDTDTSSTADATAQDGTKAVCTFGTVATLKQRVCIIVSDVTANQSDQRGSYNVLLRAKMSAGGSVTRVRMAYGFTNSGAVINPVYRSRQIITSNVWDFYELGTIEVPPGRLLSIVFNLNLFGIGISAERLSGSANLELDCLVLIPTNDGAVKLTSGMSLTNGTAAYAFQAADGSIYGSSISGIVAQPIRWGLPANDEATTVVIAGSHSSSGSVVTDTLGVEVWAFERWRALRGNES